MVEPIDISELCPHMKDTEGCPVRDYLLCTYSWKECPYDARPGFKIISRNVRKS